MLTAFPLATARDRCWWSHWCSLGSPDTSTSFFVRPLKKGQWTCHTHQWSQLHTTNKQKSNRVLCPNYSMPLIIVSTCRCWHKHFDFLHEYRTDTKLTTKETSFVTCWIESLSEKFHYTNQTSTANMSTGVRLQQNISWQWEPRLLSNIQRKQPVSPLTDGTSTPTQTWPSRVPSRRADCRCQANFLTSAKFLTYCCLSVIFFS